MPLRTAAMFCPQAVFASPRAVRPVERPHRRNSRQIFAGGGNGLGGRGLHRSGRNRTPERASSLALADRFSREITATYLSLPCSIGVGTSRQDRKSGQRASQAPWPRMDCAGQRIGTFLAPHRRCAAHCGNRKSYGGGAQSTGHRNASPNCSPSHSNGLEESFGRWGMALFRKARGIDAYEFFVDAEAKSLSHNQTFGEDTNHREQLQATLSYLSQKASKRMRDAGLHARTVTLTLRYSDFHTVTRSHTFPEPSALDSVVLKALQELFARAWDGQARLAGCVGGRAFPFFGGNHRPTSICSNLTAASASNAWHVPPISCATNSDFPPCSSGVRCDTVTRANSKPLNHLAGPASTNQDSFLASSRP